MPSRTASSEHQQDHSALDNDQSSRLRMAFTSRFTGRPAVDALTGNALGWNVGSAKSKGAFKVIDGTGRMDPDGFYLPPAERTSAPEVPATMYFATEADYKRWSNDRWNRNSL